MAPTNNFLPFCPTSTGTNLLTQSEYAAAADRTSGNQPGVASSKLNNKAIRQATAMSTAMAQFLANVTGADVLDDGVAARLLAEVTSALTAYPSVITRYASGSGTHQCTYFFQIASGNATAAATYTNNTNTFTVVTTIASGTVLRCTGNGAPAVSGTLTKATGTGDATLTFYAVRAPIQLHVIAVGGGGGGAAAGGAAGSAATAGGDTTFGASITAGGGGACGFKGSGGAGGSATIGGGVGGSGVTGGGGNGSGYVNSAGGMAGGAGGDSGIGGGGRGPAYGVVGQAASANSGGGGGGGGAEYDAAGIVYNGGGGGGGAMVNGFITTPSATYAYGVGAGGTGATAGTNVGSFVGVAGGNGGSGVILVEEIFQ